MRNKPFKVFTVSFRVYIMQDSDVWQSVFLLEEREVRFPCKYSSGRYNQILDMNVNVRY